MGKAVVYAHLGAGKYSILYTPETTASVARIAEIEALKAALDVQLYSENGLVNARTAAQTVYDNVSHAFNTALDAWAACAAQLPPCPDQAGLMAETARLAAARAEAAAAYNAVKLAIADNRSKYFTATQEIAYLNNTQKGSGAGLMTAWCIDYDDGNPIPVNTVVGTVETYGAKGGYAGGWLPRKWVNIQTSSAPAYQANRDHCVKPLSGIKTAALFFNWCQWLYVMSRNPQHAVGTVLQKVDPDQDYLDVELLGTTPGASQPAGYPFVSGQYSTVLLNVPVDYLSCGAAVFEAGDKAVVRFVGPNRASPTVIGFAESPRICVPCGRAWTWSGLAVAGVVVAKNHTLDNPPLHGNSWPVRSSYIGGQSFADERIPDDSFVHIDEVNKCWLVSLSFSWPDTNKITIAAAIKLYQSAAAPVTKSITVDCAHITLIDNGTPPTDYAGQLGKLEDVAENGMKALVGVFLTRFQVNDLFSVIEIALSGTGGADGSGLVLSGAEAIAQPSLTTGMRLQPYQYGLNSGTSRGITWTTTTFDCQQNGDTCAIQSVGPGPYLEADYPGIIHSYEYGGSWAGGCYYRSDGTIGVLRVDIGRTIDHWITGTSMEFYGENRHVLGAIGGWTCNAGALSKVNIGGAEAYWIKIYDSDTLVDELRMTRTNAGQRVVNNGMPQGESSTGNAYCYTGVNGTVGFYTRGAPVWNGSLASHFDATNAAAFEQLTQLNILQLSGKLRTPTRVDYGEVVVENKVLGLQKIDAKAAALYVAPQINGTRTYGTVSTPAGPTAHPTASAGNIYFAWNRKTGDKAFDTVPVCYV